MENHVHPHYNNGGPYAPPPPPPPPYYPHQQQMAPVISVKEWMLTMLIMAIPVVNIIMMFVFAFADGNPSKKNYFKAMLLWAAIVLVIYILIFVVFFGIYFSAVSGY
ncbi:hypothetical protein [Paenibacillus nanensis]|nr:hypothetical protein [Paenibacillus nanensis]